MSAVSPRREACRLAGAGTNQVRDGAQPQDRVCDPRTGEPIGMTHARVDF